MQRFDLVTLNLLNFQAPLEKISLKDKALFTGKMVQQRKFLADIQEAVQRLQTLLQIFYLCLHYAKIHFALSVYVAGKGTLPHE